VVEGVERALARDWMLEAIPCSQVLDRDGDRVLERISEQPDVKAVVLARGEFRVSGAAVAVTGFPPR
jgi:hypothetical protein